MGPEGAPVPAKEERRQKAECPARQALPTVDWRMTGVLRVDPDGLAFLVIDH